MTRPYSDATLDALAAAPTLDLAATIALHQRLRLADLSSAQRLHDRTGEPEDTDPKKVKRGTNKPGLIGSTLQRLHRKHAAARHRVPAIGPRLPRAPGLHRHQVLRGSAHQPGRVRVDLGRSVQGMNLCPACGQAVADPLAERRLTDAELQALSAWWWAKTVRGASRVLGLSEQTVKNQLMRARQRNQCHRTADLAVTFMGRLLTLEEVMTHNKSRRAA